MLLGWIISFTIFSKYDHFKFKVMFCIWWNYKGVIYYKFIPESTVLQIAGADTCHYAAKYLALVNRKQALQQQDNIRPHTTQITWNKLQELERIKLMSYPTYSIDLTPSDYLLVLIHGLLPAQMILKQPRGGGNFDKGVLCLKEQEPVSTSDQRDGRKYNIMLSRLNASLLLW